MKLATLKSDRRDGRLVVVSRDLRFCRAVPEIAPTLQAAIDDWAAVAPRLEAVSAALNEAEGADGMPFDPAQAAAPLPRAYQWCDGSVFIPHGERMARWLNKPLGEHNFQAPLMYQGGSDVFHGPMDPIPAFDEAWGIDFEAELAVITDDVPLGASPAEAAGHIKLLMLANDVSLRNLIPAELARGFGFYQAKPSSAFGPVAVTPDELGAAWDGARVHLPVVTHFRGQEFGRPNAGVDMLFGFPEIISHAAKTRAICAGSIFGSGTISNADDSVGSACITERRIVEALQTGTSSTEYMRQGETVRIEVFGADGASVFGAIQQAVAQAQPAQRAP